MSCQQVSRLITTVTSSVTPEDPYVFTETVPTTPPILFNTQKSRSRLTDTPQLITTITAIASAITNQKFTPAQLNANGRTKAQTSFAAIAAGAAAKTTTTTTTSPTNFKYVTQSQKHKQHQQLKPPSQQQQQWQENKRTITTTTTANVCIVRPQQQQQQRRQQLQKQQQHSPLPPLLPHTPSLWQTPLLLDTPPPPPPPPVVLVAPISPPHTTPTKSPLHTLSYPAPITQNAVAASTHTANTTHTTLLVSPLVQPPLASPPSSAATLPPSKFHHTTLAQHLQKVQCLKKPKKPLTTTTTPTTATALVETPQHSSITSASAASDDPNEIPVNVIFRKPQTQLTNNFAAAGGVEERKQQPKLAKAPKIAAKTAKLKKVKIIAPTIKATPPPQPFHLLVAPQHAVAAPPPPPQQQQLAPPKQETSSIRVVATATPAAKDAAKLEKSLQTEAQYPIVAELMSTPPKIAFKRKFNVAAPATSPSLAPYAPQKKFRKSTFAALCTSRNERFIDNDATTAVAVIKMSAAEVDADTSLLADASVLPYCVQRHWLSVYDVQTLSEVVDDAAASVLSPNVGREERIAQHKSLLRRQALQLLATRSLQKLPLQAARRRLLCVDRLLRKYRNHNEEDLAANVKKCTAPDCEQHAIEMAEHCQQHITANATQHIFLPCTAKFADNTQCRIPVFDITHDLPLCTEHARKRDAYNRSAYEQQRPRKSVVSSVSVLPSSPLALQQQHQLPPQLLHCEDEELPQMPTLYNNNRKLSPPPPSVIVATKTMPQQQRKRKITSGNPVGRPLKRAKKVATAAAEMAATSAGATPQPLAPPPLSAVLQRKNSTTSLESIASNSHSLNSQQQHYMPPLSNTSVVPASLAPPALAPLSGGNNGGSNRMLNFATSSGGGVSAVANVATVAASDLNAHEINQIVAQFAMVANNQNNNSHSHSSNYLHNNSNSNNMISSNISYNSNNMQQFMNTNSNSNFTLGLGSTTSSSASSLPTTDELLTQDMLSICENSSAYASSEDTGLGGLSETELMAGAHDDEIPLADTRLLEEHDLANVLSALPVDAFNELFTAVRQDECDEVERALELADKHLKSLQRLTIGGSDSDFLGDFLDVNDDFLDVNDASMEMGMHSPDTSGIDTSTLFIDGGSNSGAGGGRTSANCVVAAATDIRRGLVQT